MSGNKPTRPRAGFGLSSAVPADKMKTRDAAKAKSPKPTPVKSRKPERAKRER